MSAARITKVSEAKVRGTENHSLFVSGQGRPTLHVRTFGSGALHCVLLHGYGESSNVWDEFIQTAGAACHFSAIDLRGHGESDWDRHALYHVDAYVEDVAHVIRVLDWGRFVLIGHSLGAEIAIRLTERFPERIIGLVIVDFSPATDPNVVRYITEEFRASCKLYASAAEYAAWLVARRGFAQAQILFRLAQKLLRLRADGRFELKADPALGHIDSDDADLGAGRALWTLLEGMRWPVLIVRGEGSAVLARDTANLMLKALPSGTLKNVRVAGHGVMIDNPRGFDEAVQPFLQKISMSRVPM